jgi:hypothetical protein
MISLMAQVFPPSSRNYMSSHRSIFRLIHLPDLQDMICVCVFVCCFSLTADPFLTIKERLGASQLQALKGQTLSVPLIDFCCCDLSVLLVRSWCGFIAANHGLLPAVSSEIVFLMGGFLRCGIPKAMGFNAKMV